MTYKFYDTSSMLILRDELFKGDDNFIISSITLQELENIKTSEDKDSEIKYAARRLLNLLHEYRDKYDIVIFKSFMLEPIKKANLAYSNDVKILACAIHYDQFVHPDETIFVTNDFSLGCIANLFFGDDSIEMVGYEPSDHYKGYYDVSLNEEQMSDFYSQYDKNIFNLYTNEYIIIRNENHEIIDKLCWTGSEYRRLQYSNFQSKWFGDIKPIKNDPFQAFAADSMINNQLTLLKGPAGSGKTYLSLGYLFHKLDKGAINKIIIFCNPVATRNSAKLGYYPGSRDEKLLDSQIGNLLISKIGSRIEVERLIDDDVLVLLPLSDIRGYETPDNSGVYISEAQNLDVDLMQLALTRIGEKSICIIDGDDRTQVDLPAYAGDYNGIKRVSQVYRGCELYGEIELKFVHRSKIADLAQLLKATY